MRVVMSLVSLCAAVCLSGCSMYAIGPDLARTPSPFGDTSTVHVVTEDGEAIVDIAHKSEGDSGILHWGDAGGKTYAADVSWHAVDPGDDKDHVYWLAGVNPFKTKDRSAYAVLRFPIAAGARSGPAEMMIIDCGKVSGYAVAKDSSEEAMVSGDDNASAPSAPPVDLPVSEDTKAGKCDFDTLDEVYAFLAKMMIKSREEERSNAGKPDDEKSYDYQWEKVTIHIP